MKFYLKYRLKRNSDSGSAMLVSLMIMGITTMGVAAWVSLVNARREYSEANEDGMRRRVATENSSELAEEYLYRYATTHAAWNGEPDQAAAATPYDPGGSPDPNPAYNSDQPDIVERVQVDAWNGAPLNSVLTDGERNRTNPSNGGGFWKSFVVSLGTGENLVQRRFDVRSQSPILGGDLVTLNKPTLTNTNARFKGHVLVSGRTVLWRPDKIASQANNNNYRSDSYALLSSDYGEYRVKDSGGNVIRASNFPFPPTTAGATTAGALGFDGELSTVRNTVNDVNSLHAKYPNNQVEANGLTASSQQGVISDGSGMVTIDLSEDSLKKVYIHNNTYLIRLVGQDNDTDFDDADDLNPLVIVVNQDGLTFQNLQTIELYGRNNRRLILGIKKQIFWWQSSTRLRANIKWMNSRGPFSSPPIDYPTWRLIAIGENTEIKLLHAASKSEVTIFGGVRTDRGLYCNNQGNRKFFIKTEADPGEDLPELLDRNVWIESYTHTP